MVLSVIKVHRGFISVGLKVFKEKNKQTAISTIFNISDILCSLLLSLEEEDLAARATRRVSAQRYASASRNSPCGRWHLPAATRLRRRRHRWDGRGSVPLWSSINQSLWTLTAPVGKTTVSGAAAGRSSAPAILHQHLAHPGRSAIRPVATPALGVCHIKTLRVGNVVRCR